MVDKTLLAVEEDMGQVLGALMANAELLYDPNYALETKDFIREYALAFSSISSLIRRGVRQFNDDMILEYITTHFPSWKDVYVELYPENDFIKNIQMTTKMFNFEYHYNNVRKMSYMRDLNEIIDISKFYDVTGENIKLNKEFDKMTLEDIRTEFKKMVNKIDEKWVSHSSEDETLTSDTVTDEMLDDALEGSVEVGHKFPMGLEVLTHIYRGQLAQKYHLNMAGSGVGKIKCFIEKYLLNRKLGVI